MEIVYDIRLNNGDEILGCYFIEYLRKVKDGRGSTMVILPESLRCFIEGQEVLNKDFNNATVLKIYDKLSGFDLTENIIGKVEGVSKMLGYGVQFPIPRGREILE